MPMIRRRRQVALKIESVEGTAETLAAADATMLVWDPKVDLDTPHFDREPARASMSNHAGVSGTRSGTITFRVEVRGSGTATTAPSWESALRCCGTVGTTTTKIDYNPISASIPSCTIGLYADGKRYLFAGCRGNVRLVGTVGEPVMFEFSFKGKLTSHADAALLGSITYETTVPPPLLNAAFSIQGLSAKVSKFEIDIGNELTLRTDISDVTGFASCLITKRKPTIKIDPEVETDAVHDFLDKLFTDVTGTLTMTIGSTAGNKIVVTAPAVQYSEADDGEREGNDIYDLTAMLTLSSADDEVRFSHQ